MIDIDFLYGLNDQVVYHRQKWNEYGNIDELKDFAEWALILGEQAGKLQYACLQKDILEIKERIFKTAAVLYKLFCLHKKKFKEMW
ncbi:MAG: hypothetical protein ACPL5F_01500 [Moorellaceae bacterium]